MSKLTEQKEHYGAFLSAYEYFMHAVEAGRTDTSDDESEERAAQTLKMALGNRNGAYFTGHRFWDLPTTGSLNDNLALLQWQLIKLESSEPATELIPTWNDLSPEQTKLHFTRFAQDSRRLKNAQDQIGQEWEQCNKMTKEEVEEKAVNGLQGRQPPALEREIEDAKRNAWDSHEFKLESLRTERDSLKSCVSKTEEMSDFRDEIRRLAIGEGIDWEGIEKGAEINSRNDERDQADLPSTSDQ